MLLLLRYLNRRVSDHLTYKFVSLHWIKFKKKIFFRSRGSSSMSRISGYDSRGTAQFVQLESPDDSRQFIVYAD